LGQKFFAILQIDVHTPNTGTHKWASNNSCNSVDWQPVLLASTTLKKFEGAQHSQKPGESQFNFYPLFEPARPLYDPRKSFKEQKARVFVATTQVMRYKARPLDLNFLIEDKPKQILILTQTHFEKVDTNF
jgi:hypothetical protein